MDGDLFGGFVIVTGEELREFIWEKRGGDRRSALVQQSRCYSGRPRSCAPLGCRPGRYPSLGSELAQHAAATIQQGSSERGHRLMEGRSLPGRRTPRNVAPPRPALDRG